MPAAKFDAIVIGTGAGGACAAYKLVEAGLNVLALEKGPRIGLDQISEGGVFGSTFHSNGRGDELKFITQKILQPALRKEIRFLRYSEHGSNEPAPTNTFDGWMSQVVGGGTVHYGGASFRAEKIDFEMASAFSRDSQMSGLDSQFQADLKDWPIGCSEFEPWYAEAEALIGIAGAPGSGLPPLRMNKAETQVAEALRKTGDRAQVTHTPMAINTGKHDGRNACHHSGLCQEFACRFEAKSDMRVTVLRKAERTGRLTIQPSTFARKLIHRNGRVLSVECIAGDPEKDAKIENVSAPIIVVACEVVESIRLLLNSGIGNPDVIGKYVMYHVTGGARSISPHPTTTWDNAPHTAYIPSYYTENRKGPQPFYKTGIILFSSLNGPLQAISGRLEGKYMWGEEALRFFNEIYPFKLDLSYIGEGLPTAYNRVELKRDALDRFGMPATVITYRPHPYDMNAGAFIKEECRRILKLSGCMTQDVAPPEIARHLGKETTAQRLFHGTGGCRFGEDPKTSVLTPDCRVHEFENLFVTDGSFMPTGLGLNPTLTMQANALRVGAEIVSQFG